MSDQGTARRVSISEQYRDKVWAFQDDPNGTHILVTAEEWEQKMTALELIAGKRGATFGWVEARDIARRALEEIGGEDE